jgi:hypothetical protein
VQPRQQCGRIDWDGILDKYEDDLREELSGRSDWEAGMVFHSYLHYEVDEVDKTDWEVRFMSDGEKRRVDCIDTQDGVLYDFKTKNQNGMTHAPYDEDIGQLEDYLEALDADLGFLVYVDRETLELEYYPVLD